MEEKGFDPIDVLLEKPFWIVDPLPYQVPAEGEGQFFAVESFFLESSRRRLLLKRHRHVRRAGDQIMEIMKALTPD